MKIAIADDVFYMLSTEQLQLLTQSFDAVLFNWGELQKFAEDLKTVQVLCSRYFGPESFNHFPQLKLLQLPIAGFEHLNTTAIQEHGIFICNNGGANAASVAEHTLLLMLGLLRQIPYHLEVMRQGQFKNRKYQSQELSGKCLGILGMGNIGQQVARKVRSLDMKVQYYDVKDIPPERCCGAAPVSFEQLLETSDILSIHLPLTSKTRGLVDRQFIRSLRPECYLINTARGEIVNEEDLTSALLNKEIAGAGLDVFYPEPLSPDSKLRSLSNVIATPHMASSFDSLERTVKLMLSNMQALQAGEPLQSVIPDYEQYEFKVPWN